MTDSNEKLQKLINGFGVAMLVTRTPEGSLRARPMAIADAQPNGSIWLMTESQSGKMDEIAEDNHVSVTMQSSTQFVSISGKAYHCNDRQKVAELWKDTWKVWFPKGKDDPNLALLLIEGDSAEYWDQSGLQGVKYLFEAGKALLSGTRPDVGSDTKIHSKVEL